ncbi:hypothetical protein C4D60_Mb10t12300 [Musa balbisiana]|uniref:Protein TIFY n=1 Tax=Musa balbisiana TaxID=52838 RepID=A0A4V4H4R9_MUSBA|nr:hypothetical protein C4D60_Mb10t12300 [Musa balbisiana]
METDGCDPNDPLMGNLNPSASPTVGFTREKSGWYHCTCFLVSLRRKAVISVAKHQQHPVASPPATTTTSCDPSPLLMERDFLGLNGDAAVALQVKERSRSFQDSSGPPFLLVSLPSILGSRSNLATSTFSGSSDSVSIFTVNPAVHCSATIASDCPLVSHYSTPLAGNGGATAAEDHSVRSTFLGDRSSWNTSKSFSSPSQLTIFYGGSVIVYDNVSSDMAREIMLLASSRIHAAAASTPVSLSPATATSPKAIPLSRKASLARFVEKRKQRMINYKPYPFCDKRKDANSSAAVTLPSHENSDSDSGPSSHRCQ